MDNRTVDEILANVGLTTISQLEENEIYISLHYDFYANGTNTIFGINFKRYDYHTGWFGDNHEFGGMERTYRCALAIAKRCCDKPALILADRNFKRGRDHENTQVYKDYIEFKKFIVNLEIVE